MPMNFLAHLHLAHLADSSLIGNIVADFVRGSSSKTYSTEVYQGILMHRRVDAYVDQYPDIRACLPLFSAQTRRVAPITLDIVWDHFLAKHWHQFHPQMPLNMFCQQSQLVIMTQLEGMPEAFITLNKHLWQERWLENYADVEFIERVLIGMANRRPKLTALKASFYDFKNNYSVLEKAFFTFYPALMQRAQRGDFLSASE